MGQTSPKLFYITPAGWPQFANEDTAEQKQQKKKRKKKKIQHINIFKLRIIIITQTEILRIIVSEHITTAHNKIPPWIARRRAAAAAAALLPGCAQAATDSEINRTLLKLSCL